MLKDYFATLPGDVVLDIKKAYSLPYTNIPLSWPFNSLSARIRDEANAAVRRAYSVCPGWCTVGGVRNVLIHENYVSNTRDVILKHYADNKSDILPDLRKILCREEGEDVYVEYCMYYLIEKAIVHVIQDAISNPTCRINERSVFKNWTIIDTSIYQTGLQDHVPTHVLKIRPEHFITVDSGHKKAEVRKTDREYNVGDRLIFVVDNTNLARTDPFYGAASSVKYQITHILKHEDFPEGIKEGYAVLSIAPVKEKL